MSSFLRGLSRFSISRASSTSSSSFFRSFPSASSSSSASSFLSSSASSSSSFSCSLRFLHVLRSIAEVRSARLDLSGSSSCSVGFVPTMGALHAGHIDLVRQSRTQNSVTIVSIFVNPTQFAPGEDLDKYPRQLESDLSLLKAEGVDYVFVPDNSDMYPPNPPHATFVEIENINKVTAEGAARPGHFRGVATVVTKLFNIVQPHRAYFGQKDGVQCIVINRLVRELNIPVQIVICPTKREKDGLAMSSRNMYLSPQDRLVAPIVYKSLLTASKLFNEQNITGVSKLKEVVRGVLESEPSIQVQYVSCASTLSGEEIVGNIGGSGMSDVTGGGQMSAMISVAVKLGKTRLIDNMVLTRVRTSMDV